MTHTIRTTQRPDVEVTVDDAEYAYLLELGLIYDGTPPLAPVDFYDQTIADRVNQLDSVTRDALAGALPDLIDTTPITAADFGLAVPEGVRAYANATGQVVTAGAYPVYLDLNALEFNENTSLFTVDLAGNRVTVNEAGLFMASWDVNYSDSAGLREAYLTKNGGNAISAAAAGAGGLTYRSYPLRLAPGDYVQVICYVEGANQTLITNAPFRCGLALHRLGL